MSTELVGTCEQEGCKIVSGGTCLEGFADLNSCPFFRLTTDQAEGRVSNTLTPDFVESSTAQLTIPEMIPLPGVNEFTLETASEVTYAALTRLIVIAGEADSGKTTLLASLINKFQKGHPVGYQFAESRTLIGFEKLCHLARLASGGIKPDTERTKPSIEHKLLHLTVRSTETDTFIQDLLLTDISGETFRLAKDYIEECQKLELLRRADRFVLLLDGEKLASPSQREEAYQGGALILRRCLEAGMLDSNSYIDVLFAKYDLIQPDEKITQTKEFLQRIKNRLRQRYENRVGRLRFFKVVARPDNPSFSGENQLDEVFSTWVEETPIYNRHYYLEDSIKLTSDREFDRYLLRHRS
jgi:hypothetical protein